MANAAKQLGQPFDELPAKPVEPPAEAPQPQTQPNANNGIPEDRRGFVGYVDGRFERLPRQAVIQAIGQPLVTGWLGDDGLWFFQTHYD